MTSIRLSAKNGNAQYILDVSGVCWEITGLKTEINPSISTDCGPWWKIRSLKDGTEQTIYTENDPDFYVEN